MTLSGTGHPGDVPAELIAALEDSSERELRESSDIPILVLPDRGVSEA
jgi:hypothetical protein